MTGKVDPLSLPRVTPSKLGDKSRYQPRRRPDTNGMPDPRNAFRLTIDPPLLTAIVAATTRAHIADAVPHDWRDRVRDILVDDIDARFPAAHMAILDHHDSAKRICRVLVLFQRYGRSDYFDIPVRTVPLVGQPQLFKTSDEVDTGPIALVPAAALPFFEARAAALADVADLAPAADWPRRFNHQHKRPPTWAEIETAFPRIGAWMANKREPS